MPPGASEPTYRFAFSWEGPYGHCARLIEAHAPEGLVLDLGCGYGAVAEVLAGAGRTYVGIDRDKEAVADLGVRGFESHVLDLGDTEHLGPRLAEILDGRRLGAVLLLDFIEHLPEPDVALTELAAFVDFATPSGASPPVVVVSIPNVAHVDLAAKLVGGRWDVTPSGLLDRTHLSLFTEARLTDELTRCGLSECGRDDVVLDHSDQHFPRDHPYLVAGGPVYEHLRALRSAAGPNTTVNQFVRAYRWADAETGARPVPDRHGDRGEDGQGEDVPLLSVLTRTEGRRMGMLAEALTCLAAQTIDDLEVVLLVDSGDEEVVESCRQVVSCFDSQFSSRVRLEIVAEGGGRTRPLNRGLEVAKGRYVAFLDDDDLVTADWAERFKEAIERCPGTVVRSVSHSRHLRRRASEEAVMGDVPVTLSRPMPEFAERFDLLSHLAANETPNLSVAIPMSLVSELGLCFDERFEVCEDWDLLVRAALLVGVEDTGHVTGIYQRWDDGGSTTAGLPPRAWVVARRMILDRLDALPLLLPKGSALKLGHLVTDPELGVKRSLAADLDETREALDVLRKELEAAKARVADLEERAVTAEHARDEAEQARDEIADSEFWKMTAPVRVPLTKLAGRRRRQEPGPTPES